MKKIYYLFIILLAFSNSAFCQQKKEKEVEAAVEAFRKAYVDADRGQLEALTAEELVFGHSSGKVQNKAEFIDEITSLKPLDYVTADFSNQTIKIAGNTAVVRHIFFAETTSNGKAGSLRIGVMLIWQNQKGKWKLLARQAYRI